MKDEIYVDHKDRDDKINQMRIFFNMMGINVSYIYADLLYTGLEDFTKKEGKFSIRDVSQIQATWEKKWDLYKKEKE